MPMTDVALALRLLIRRPGFTLVALATLALGIGAPTAVFSIVHAVLLRPLPYPDADRVVRFRIESQTPRGQAGFDALPVSEALQWASQSSTLSDLGLFNETAMTMATADGPVRLTGVAATPSVFAVLKVPPVVGRTFDATTSDARQIVLSHATWQRYFDGQPSVAGSLITMDGRPHRITGVMPRDFQFPTPDTAFWVPLLLETGGSRGMLLPAIARLRDGISPAAVVEEGRRVLSGSGDERVEQTLLARTVQDQMVGSVRRVLWVLMAAVSLVSVIATVNIALLLLTRGASRVREFSVRLALGASRGRLVRQLCIEGITLAVAGGAAGLMFAKGALAMLVSLAPPDLPRLSDATLDGQVLIFAAGLILLACLVFGVLSAGRLGAVDAVRALAGASTEARLMRAAVPRRRLNALAAAELALAMVLLVGAGLLLRTFVRLVLVDQGFQPRGGVVAQVTLPAARYPTPERRLTFHQQLLDRLSQLGPGVTAGLITSMPNRQPTGRFAYDADGIPVFLDHFDMQIAEVRMATEGFIEAMGIPVLSGRTIRADDTAGSESVIVLSQGLARRHFPDRDPLGQLLYSESGNRRVVGVVGDVRPAAPDGIADPGAYLPLRQSYDVLQWFATINIAMRGADPSLMTSSLRTIVTSLDSELPVFNVRTLDREVAALVAGPRFTATVLGLFAAVAVLMAGIGVYGVMSYGTAQRTSEIGVRMALGATGLDVMRLVLRDGLVVVGGGLFAGALASVWLARTLTGLLHEVTPMDPAAVLWVAAVLAVIGLIAVVIPARRATRVSALTALRHD
jgi:putative ABC transport system permease protein